MPQGIHLPHDIMGFYHRQEEAHAITQTMEFELHIKMFSSGTWEVNVYLLQGNQDYFASFAIASDSCNLVKGEIRTV